MVRELRGLSRGICRERLVGKNDGLTRVSDVSLDLGS